MTADTVFIENGLDLGTEVDSLLAAADTQEQQKGDEKSGANVCHDEGSR
ncbi:hypothetical protein WBG78_29510 [Chryseolinea sp. T2]